MHRREKRVFHGLHDIPARGGHAAYTKDFTGLLRPQRERPHCCAAEQCDELTPSHSHPPISIHEDKLSDDPAQGAVANGASRLRLPKWVQSSPAAMLSRRPKTFGKQTESLQRRERRMCVMSGLAQAQHTRGLRRSYSIISSARASSEGGMVRPSAFAVLRLTTSSNLVGCCTGRLAGSSPLRMRSMYEALRRKTSTVSTP
jgi:hypothetical protein